MAHDQSPLPAVSGAAVPASVGTVGSAGGAAPGRPQIAALLGPSGLGTSAARLASLSPSGRSAGTPQVCTGTEAVGGEAAQLAVIAPGETVRSVVSALMAASLTDDPVVIQALPEVLRRVQEDLRGLTRTVSTCG